MSEFMWLLWIFAAALVAGAVITLVAYGAGIAAGVFVETYHAHRVRHRRAWVRRAIERGERAVVRELAAPRPGPQRLSALPPLPTGTALAARACPSPSGTVLRFERDRAGLTVVADAAHEERT
ncbi:MAG: hypothetical protein K0S43_384 [Cellulosimicrobium sp.]|nr:hypothetical protein [Cellulosimicrobium sp.]